MRPALKPGSEGTMRTGQVSSRTVFWGFSRGLFLRSSFASTKYIQDHASTAFAQYWLQHFGAEVSHLFASAARCMKLNSPCIVVSLGGWNLLSLVLPSLFLSSSICCPSNELFSSFGSCLLVCLFASFLPSFLSCFRSGPGIWEQKDRKGKQRKNMEKVEKTRSSPRTRMQSRRTLL